jgi:phospholipid N-methyltransferase
MSEKSDDVARTKFGSAFQFVEAFLREPLTVGSLWPSSAALSRAVADSCDFGPADTVVELGPGTGSFTELLLERLDERGQLLAFEISETNIKVLRERFPRCRAIHDSAENLPRHLGGSRARCIVSGLAWGNMLPAAQDRIMNAIVNSLTPDGQFVAFAYVHARYYPTTLRFRKMMFRNFKRVETTPITWRNLPPAYVYRCWRTQTTAKTTPANL